MVRPATIPITEIEHSAFCKTEDELPSKSLAEEMAVNVRWQPVASKVSNLSLPIDVAKERGQLSCPERDGARPDEPKSIASCSQ